jgi:hypothetical protein
VISDFVFDLSLFGDVRFIEASSAGKIQLFRGPDGVEVAVKCFNENPSHKFHQRTFSRGIEPFGQLQHLYVVSILGYVS